MKNTNKGFTLIELLIVIAVLGILAVAVLSAINPIEQINRSRDTGSQSDAEQLIGAIDRFYANQGYYPWQTGTEDTTDFPAITQITALAPVVTGSTCTMLNRLANGDPNIVGCAGAQELKGSYATKITAVGVNGQPTNNPLYIYFDGSVAGNSFYVCFRPVSGSFQTSTAARCANALPADLPAAVICQVDVNGDSVLEDLSCLP
jgi:prepilin-type N-terminal cleavage/methylation domain-containing protein